MAEKRVIESYGIVIPVWNEGKVIYSVLSELKRLVPSTIVVFDDGSTDNTYTEAKKARVIVIRHVLNRGKGAAIKTGIEKCKALGLDVVVTFDGDGQHDPHDVLRMLTQLSDGYDVVLGSRFLTPQSIPLMKKIWNRMANYMTYILFGVWVTDSQSGFRAYRKTAFMIFDTKSDRYEFDTEVIRDIRHHSLRYKEIPIHVRYTPYSQTKETKQNFSSGMQTVLNILIRE